MKPVGLVVVWRICLFGVLLLVMTLGLSTAFQSVGKLQALRDNGSVVQGSVTDLSITRGKSTSYHVGYRFNVKSHEYDSEELVDSGFYARLAVGGPVTVTFDRANPSNCVLGAVDGDRLSHLLIQWCLGLGAVTAIACVLLYAIAVTVRKQTAILESYIAVPAKVQLVGPPTGSTSVTRDVTYYYRNLNGVPAERIDSVDNVVGKGLIGVENTTALINPKDDRDVRLLATMSLVECVGS